MDLNKTTQKLREALQSAQALAVRLSHQEVDGEHLLAELLVQDGGLAPRLVERAGTSVDTLASDIQKALSKLPTISGGFQRGG